MSPLPACRTPPLLEISQTDPSTSGPPGLGTNGITHFKEKWRILNHSVRGDHSGTFKKLPCESIYSGFYLSAFSLACLQSDCPQARVGPGKPSRVASPCGCAGLTATRDCESSGWFPSDLVVPLLCLTPEPRLPMFWLSLSWPPWLEEHLRN